jgi:BMFP domain-containing protein YqiC
MTRVISSAKRIWNELDYAQRRSFELKTGVPVVKADRRQRLTGSVEELEALYGFKSLER